MTVDLNFSTSIIKEQFDNVIKYSQNLNHVNTDELFQKWRVAKDEFIKAWNGPIYKTNYKVTFELSPEDRKARLSNFIQTVEETFNNVDLANFIYRNFDGFYKNEVIEDDCWFGTRIPKGMKLLKAFKYFEDDVIALKDIQTAASMIIQEDKVEGYLCLSVHPLDFLSSSENTYNWRSCHALDGEYRSGNLSYMMDKCTFMCYLCDGKYDKKLMAFPDSILWNSKKWRMLIYLSEDWDCMFAGRQYPFFSKSALNSVLQAFQASTGTARVEWRYWHNDQIVAMKYAEPQGYEQYFDDSLRHRYIPLFGNLYPIDEVVKDAPDAKHFNDVLRSSCYKPYYTSHRFSAIIRKPFNVPKFTIGGQIPCVCCGTDKVIVTDSMLCENCELEFGDSKDDRFTYCSCCERRIIAERGHYIPSTNEIVCDYCYEQEVSVCEECGENIYKSDMVYNKGLHKYFCKNCNRKHTLGIKDEKPKFAFGFDSSIWDDDSLPFQSNEQLREALSAVARGEQRTDINYTDLLLGLFTMGWGQDNNER